jgi:hypothetical protein
MFLGMMSKSVFRIKAAFRKVRLRVVRLLNGVRFFVVGVVVISHSTEMIDGQMGEH